MWEKKNMNQPAAFSVSLSMQEKVWKFIKLTKKKRQTDNDAENLKKKVITGKYLQEL